MKLFILWSIKKKKIFAISEYKKDIQLFFLQNGYTKSDYIIHTLTNEKLINKILVTKNELYLIDYYNFVIREKDKTPLDEIIYSNIKLVEDTMSNIDYINSEYIIEPKYHKLFSKIYKILKNKIRKHNILKFINISNIISDYYKNTYFRDVVNEFNKRGGY